MKIPQLKVLHIIREYKFYLLTLKNFNRPYYNNLFVFNTSSAADSEKEKIEKVRDKIIFVCNYKEILDFINNRSVDIIYFHSLPPTDWKFVSKISNEITVVWWVWGYDIYFRYGLIKPFISVKLYKPITKAIVNQENKKHYVRKIKRIIASIYFSLYKSKALNNISYIETVTKTEFDILHKLPEFRHIKKFYSPYDSTFEKLSTRAGKQYILVGNSSSDTNNHLDIFDSLKKIGFKEKDVIVPLSYGSERYAEIINENIALNNYPFNINIIKSFLPKEQYENIFNHISHAIYGVMRQQAMGNIAFCLLHGVKIFLYKESILYKDLKCCGYVIYNIEEQLTLEELITSLSQEDASHNYSLWIKTREENEIKAKEVVTEIEIERASI